ncbi:MAG TPA: acetyl-CoA carboxylase carboxyltransferase subunit alpha, partial [Candidatus Limnocylindrales bacterium]
KRPHTLELLKAMADEFIELHGDRLFGDDSAIVAGLARIAGRRIVVIGFQKGQDTEENIRRNFGLPHPEGYRKAMRAMDLAERYAMPVLTFVDVQGAFPGAAAEERGIAEAIAKSVGLMTRLRTPIVVVITGEGGSGGALGLAVGDVVLALENSIYAVISPEGCATILWRSAEQSQLAAVAMKVTAGEQHELGIVDAVIPEPGEGAHTDPAETARLIREAVIEQLDELGRIPLDELVEARFQRYRAYGPFTVADRSAAPPERVGIADRLRGLLTGRAAMPAFPGTRRGGSSDHEEE